MPHRGSPAEGNSELLQWCSELQEAIEAICAGIVKTRARASSTN
jgi:hypothetical protein